MDDGAVQVTDQPLCTRLILRGRANAIAAATIPLGFALPLQPCRSVTVGARNALWLGPDEWLILAPSADPIAPALSHAMQSHPHALVDVSHRQCALQLTGAGATETLNAGCPLDLDDTAFPIGMCTRTVLAKSEIVLWRRATETFHLEIARSFAPYVRAFLLEAARDVATD